MNENERIVATRNWVNEQIVQSDWNTNDENDLSYVKNRTHWEEELTPITIFEEQEVELVVDRYFASSNHLGFVLKPNTKYRVILDGKEYEGVSYYLNEYKHTIYLFNELYENDNPDDIFCIVTYLRESEEEEPSTYLEIREEYEGTHTFTLYELITNVHQLDPKFIPTATTEEVYAMMLEEGALPIIQTEDGAVLTIAENEILMI